VKEVRNDHLRRRELERKELAAQSEPAAVHELNDS
jgi:hypothetical protein